jgi:hypothetical protein
MIDSDEEATRTYLDKVDPNAANRRTVEQQPSTVVAQQRCLPGTPQPADGFLAEYQQHNAKRRERIPGPLWVFWAPNPTDVFRWRIQLDCGCVEERIKHSLGGDDNKPTSTIATASDVDPLSRERLPPGEFLCCGKHRKRAKPIRDFADWGERTVREFAADPIEPPELWADEPDIWAVIRRPEPQKSAFWKTLLVCGHFGDVVTDVEWKPEDGPTYPGAQRLEEMRAEGADLDRWHKRLLAAGWPRPAPFQECYMCSVVRNLVAYEPVDWVAPRPKPIKPPTPKPPSRKSLQARLKKLDAEAEQLRQQLKALDE